MEWLLHMEIINNRLSIPKELPDIQSKEDLIALLNRFYQKALIDDEIGFFFTKVVQLNLEKHIPVIASFWDNILFSSTEYKGNPMQVHMDIYRKHWIEKKHFDRWLLLFSQSVDEMFVGNKAHLIKERALSIATVMQIKFATIS